MSAKSDVLVEFDVSSSATPLIKLSGVDPDLLRDPERVRKIMEVLDLPEGTKARVAYYGHDVIVR